MSAGGGDDIAEVARRDRTAQPVSVDDRAADQVPEAPPDAAYLQAVGQPRVDVVVLGHRKNLRLVVQTAKR